MDNIFRFANFEADRERYQLRKETRPIKLERIPLELLFLLLENHGKLVSRAQIVDKLWGSGLFLDTDRSINTAIRKIRRALGDDPHYPRFVETVVGQGYRFVASLVSKSSTQSPSPDSQGHSRETKRDDNKTEIRLRDFIIEAESETPVLTCNVVIGEVSLGRFTLLELNLPSDVNLPLKPLDRLRVSLHGVRATLTSDASQALNVLSTYILQDRFFSTQAGIFEVDESSSDRPSLQFAEQTVIHSHR